jgi:hypothetical protein
MVCQPLLVIAIKIDVVQLELRKSHVMDFPLETNTVYNAR